MELLLVLLMGALASAVALSLAAVAAAILLDRFHPEFGSIAQGRRARGQCAECGYDLTGNTSGVCPECGTSCGTSTPRPPR
jgi:uncharacterized paraquat-inducible protein A